MEEMTQDDGAATNSTRAATTTRPAGQRRKLLVMRSGTRLFAVYADEVEATSENSKPTPLPFAPAPVRGVVSQRGQILTVIDPLSLLPRETHSTATTTTPTTAATTNAPTGTSPLIVALRGDEQLALSVERLEPGIELYDDDADIIADESPGPPLLRRIIQHPTGAISLLNPAHLFEAAMQGVERRRRRKQ